MRIRAALLLFVVLGLVAACGGADEGSTSGGTKTLRLGYFGNVTHAPALIGEEKGFFAKALGPDAEVKFSYFNAGPEALEALFAGSIDATFIGPNPAINGFARSKGEALRIVAGSTSGGASLVVRDGIYTPADLKGKKLASPQLGNTQDVALRAWLGLQGFKTDKTGAGDVSVQPQANADTLTAFVAGSIDGAWVPEPWASRLVLEGKGHVLIDERDLWPNQMFVTTHLIVAKKYLDQNSQVVQHLVSGLLDSIDFAAASPTDAKAVTNTGIRRITTKALPEATIDAAWPKMSFTVDPIASSLQKSKDDAVKAGLLEDVDLTGIYDLGALNNVLAARGKEAVSGL